MNCPVVFFTNSVSSCRELTVRGNSVLFHGKAVDERGQTAMGEDLKNVASRVMVEYDYALMTIDIGGNKIDADKATNAIAPIINGRNVVLESTTLGFAELFLLIRSLIDLKKRNFLIVYIEPEQYSRTQPGGDSFALSELNVGYKPIPRSVIDLAGDDVTAGVFFLGFEPERLERAFEEYQMIAHKDVKVVFGIPAFHPGWELNSIVPHLKSIDNCDVQYCSANDPSSAYDALEVTRCSLDPGNKMFVAPIGTKPCGIATAIFASIYPEQVGLLFDHRKKMSKRSKGVGVCHSYSIVIKSN